MKISKIKNRLFITDGKLFRYSDDKMPCLQICPSINKVSVIRNFLIELPKKETNLLKRLFRVFQVGKKVFYNEI